MACVRPLYNVKLGVVVVQWRQRNVQKQHDARAKLLFCQSSPIAFMTFSSPSPSSDLKVPIWNNRVPRMIVSNNNEDKNENRPRLLFEEMLSIKTAFIVPQGKLFGSNTNINIKIHWQDKSALGTWPTSPLIC